MHLPLILYTRKEELAGLASCVTLRAQERQSDRIADWMLVLNRIRVGEDFKEADRISFIKLFVEAKALHQLLTSVGCDTPVDCSPNLS